ncbi:hypothetical protein AB0I22_09880 [Streptomyces sp. NPDC050610]|uniref:restriction endonuclease subunit S n=1 Tax=Streptomyces sp. NPDC050610 TaxID=3157097 RepID=UPI003437A77A
MAADSHLIDVDSAAWPTTSIEVERAHRSIFTTCGFLEDETGDRASGVVGSSLVQGGRILSSGTNHRAPRVSRSTRATLREGDLAVVLVRRVGESALVTAEHEGWTATRSVGIIRADTDIAQWLRIWLQTPTAKARIDEDVTAHVEPTISLDTLRHMPFPLPSPDVIAAYNRAFGLIEETVSVYRRAARKAVELADALHEDWSSSDPPWETRSLARVAKLKTGKGSERSLPPSQAEPTVDVVAPKDLYDLPVPHVPRFRLSGPANVGEVHPPGTIMLSTRSDGAYTAVACRPAVPLRGVLAIRPIEGDDSWWLLHELRSRSGDVARMAQGQNGREISALALKRLEITWPDRFTRAGFHRTAEPLHAAARLAGRKIATLHALRDALLGDISAKAGVLREPTAEPGELDAGTARSTVVPQPREGSLGNESGWIPEERRVPE